MNLLPPTCAFGSAVTWAVASVGYSSLSKEYSVFSLNFARAMIALPLCVVSAFLVSGGYDSGLLSYQSLNLQNFEWLGLSMVASYGLGDASFFLSTRYLGVLSALAISSCYPIWTIFMGSLYSAEDVSLLQLCGVGVTILGLITVILNRSRTNNEPSASGLSGGLSGDLSGTSAGLKKWSLFLGVGLATFASILWAINSFATAKGGMGIITPVGNTVRMMFALFLTAGLGRFLTPASSLVLPRRILRKFFWVFVLEAFAGSYMYVYGMSNSSLAVGATLSSLSPVVSVPVAVLFGIEKFSILRTLGVCITVAGVSLLVGQM